MKRLLVVEDEKLLRDELAVMLENAGYQVEKITDFHNVTEQILSSSPDLILLDLNLPNESGFQICRQVKAKSSLPILVLTSRERLKDEIQALKLGADEYLTKPFRKERLLIRISNLLRRYRGRANLLERDDFLLDKHTYTLYIHGKSVVLAANQGKLLEAFLLSESRVLTKEELATALWGTTEFIDETALQVNIMRLRKVMHDVGMLQQIETVRGVGYRLLEDGNSSPNTTGSDLPGSGISELDDNGDS
ncbi:MAG: response regulator transcription factor [Bacillota bacterium]|nr:response regulator transcription factor [Bacillota bacterium]